MKNIRNYGPLPVDHSGPVIHLPLHSGCDLNRLNFCLESPSERATDHPV
jgi:hypothetical protein